MGYNYFTLYNLNCVYLLQFYIIILSNQNFNIQTSKFIKKFITVFDTLNYYNCYKINIDIVIGNCQNNYCNGFSIQIT